MRWHTCIERTGPRTENIEVRGTHSGLGCNMAATIAVADRLAQPAGTWRPFVAPPLLKALFPAPASWDGSAERRPAGLTVLDRARHLAGDPLASCAPGCL